MDIEALLAQPFYKIADKSLLLLAYKEAFSIELCSTCQASYFQAYQELKKLTRIKKEEIMAKKKACKYEFKEEHKGSTIHLKGYNFPITEETLTDEIAEKLLEYEVYKEIITLAQPSK